MIRILLLRHCTGGGGPSVRSGQYEFRSAPFFQQVNKRYVPLLHTAYIHTGMRHGLGLLFSIDLTSGLMNSECSLRSLTFAYYPDRSTSIWSGVIIPAFKYSSRRFIDGYVECACNWCIWFIDKSRHYSQSAISKHGGGRRAKSYPGVQPTYHHYAYLVQIRIGYPSDGSSHGWVVSQFFSNFFSSLSRQE